MNRITIEEFNKMKLLEQIEYNIALAKSVNEPEFVLDVEDMGALVKLIRSQHAIIAPLNHHSEFGGDDDIVEAIEMYNELSDKVLP